MMLCFMNLSAFAAEVSEVTIDYPNIAALINGINNNEIDSSKVKATLDGKELKVSSAESKTGSTEWIILIDTSKSTKTYFEAEKKAVVSVNNSLGENDKLSLYTFDTGIVKILDGSESKEDAEKKINAIECTGQDTVFYEATDKLLTLASESKADNVIPVIFSDGIDTISKTVSKEKVSEKLSASKVPVYGFYADKLKAETSDNFNALLAKSKGGAKAFSEKNATSLLSEKTPAKKFIVSAVADSDIEANENAELIIDLGNGNVISKSVNAPEYKAETSTSDASTSESTTAENNGENDDSSFPIIPVIAVVVIITVAAAVLLFLKKKKNAAKPEENVETAPETTSEAPAEISENKEDAKPEEEKKSKEKKAKAKKSKDEAQFQFYFVDKK